MLELAVDDHATRVGEIDGALKDRVLQGADVAWLAELAERCGRYAGGSLVGEGAGGLRGQALPEQVGDLGARHERRAHVQGAQRAAQLLGVGQRVAGEGGLAFKRSG